MTTDPIADMLTRIRNAGLGRMEKVDIPASKLKLEIARILKDEGFVKNFRILKDRRQNIIRVYLNLDEKDQSAIMGLKRVSRPGRRVYVGADEIPRVMGGLGVVILSTPKGVLTDKQSRAARVGGEMLCYVW
ncbi:MAG: 30S ribosomal protein S8 [Nitrospirota bacterium]|nr:30S ribosomal protein S8 [Nitrospirota bacterium]